MVVVVYFIIFAKFIATFMPVLLHLHPWLKLLFFETSLIWVRTHFFLRKAKSCTDVLQQFKTTKCLYTLDAWKQEYMYTNLPFYFCTECSLNAASYFILYYTLKVKVTVLQQVFISVRFHLEHLFSCTTNLKCINLIQATFFYHFKKSTHIFMHVNTEEWFKAKLFFIMKSNINEIDFSFLFAHSLICVCLCH